MTDKGNEASSSAVMEPLLHPTAPPAEMPHQNPPAPPSYNEAMGWSQPQQNPALYPPPQQSGGGYSPGAYSAQYAPGHRPITNVTPNPMLQQPASQPVHQPPNLVVVQQVMPSSVVLVGPKPAKVDCPACHASIKTTTVTTNKTLAHVACLILMCVGCWPCCWVPYCMESCKQVSHTCPNCKSHLGSYNG